METSFIYYDKRTGKVLSISEAKEEWELAKKEKRPTNMNMSLASNLIIEDGYVKEKNIVTVADLIAKSKAQEEEMQKTETLDSLLPPPRVPAPEPLPETPEPQFEIKAGFQSQAIIDNLIASYRAEEEKKEKERTAIIDEIIEDVRAEEQKKDAVLEEIIQSVIAEDERIQAEKARAENSTYSINDIIAETSSYPPIDSTQYNVDQIIQEYGSKPTPRFIDITQSVLSPDLDNPTDSFKPTEEEKKVGGEPLPDIQDPEYSIRIVNAAQARKQDPAYSTLVKSSVIEGEIVDFERTGERRGIKYQWLVNGLVALATVSILFTGAKLVTNIAGNIVDNIKTNSAITNMSSEYNFVNDNKIILDGTFDSYGHPAYWIDTKGIAQEILSKPDEAYIGSLYLTYNQLGNDRENGPYHNLDDTIGHISALVDETHPTAFLTTAGCRTFEEFLIQAGFFNPETKEPSVAAFEEAGKNAIMQYINNIQNNNQNMGGRI